MPRATGRPVALLPSGGSVMACRKTMRIKDVRQGLHTLVHTQGLDGLLHLYQRLEKRGRALLLCLLCAEAGVALDRRTARSGSRPSPGSSLGNNSGSARGPPSLPGIAAANLAR